jgi:hypothetical protein
VLLVGCAQPTGGNHTLRSTDGGATWASIASGTGVTVHPEEFGSSTQWWAADKPYLDTDGRNFVASDIAVDPDDPGTLLLAGRGGAYVAVVGPSGVDWWPSMRGLMVTVNMVVAADPRRPGYVHVGNMDWTYLPSQDNGATFVDATSPVGAPTPPATWWRSTPADRPGCRRLSTWAPATVARTRAAVPSGRTRIRCRPRRPGPTSGCR